MSTCTHDSAFSSEHCKLEIQLYHFGDYIVLSLFQYPTLFSQCVLMVTFLYIQPYKSTAANIAEAVLSTSTIIMLLLSFRISPETFPIVVSDMNSTCSNENSIIILSTWVCSVLYYSTLLVSIAMIVQSLVVFVR